MDFIDTNNIDIIYEILVEENFYNIQHYIHVKNNSEIMNIQKKILQYIHSFHETNKNLQTDLLEYNKIFLDFIRNETKNKNSKKDIFQSEIYDTPISQLEIDTYMKQRETFANVDEPFQKKIIQIGNEIIPIETIPIETIPIDKHVSWEGDSNSLLKKLKKKEIQDSVSMADIDDIKILLHTILRELKELKEIRNV